MDAANRRMNRQSADFLKSSQPQQPQQPPPTQQPQQDGSQAPDQSQALKPGQWDPATQTDVDPVTGRRFWTGGNTVAGLKRNNPLRSQSPQAGLDPNAGGVRYEDPSQSQAAKNDLFYKKRKPQGMPQGMV